MHGVRMPRLRSFWSKDRCGEDPMKTAMIAGIGNVLLGDDGIGPYVVRLLESRYSFGRTLQLPISALRPLTSRIGSSG